MADIIYPVQKKYLEKFRDERDKVILEMEKYAKANNVPILNWNAADLLEQMIMMYKPKRVLELGTAIAYSSIRVARRLPGNGVIDTIEKSPDNIKVAERFIKKSKLGSKINILEGNALNIMPKLKRKYDFIFLDADKIDYEALFNNAMKLLKVNGVIFIDNLLWHGLAASSRIPKKHKVSTKHIRNFNKLFSAQKNLKKNIIPVGDGVGIGIKLK